MLKEQYPYRIELHAHTSPVSVCSEVSPKELVEIYAAKGYDAVVITNHFAPVTFEGMTKKEAIDYYMHDFEETQKAAQKYNMKVLLGAEIRFEENANDYLIFGVDRDILSKSFDYIPLGVERFRKEIKLNESVFVQAHPFRKGMTLCNPSLLDGIETFNMHPNHNSKVSLAVKYAKENNFAITTAGTDFHHPNLNHEASAALRSKILPQNSFDIASILKSGDYVFEIGENAIVLP